MSQPNPIIWVTIAIIAFFAYGRAFQLELGEDFCIQEINTGYFLHHDGKSASSLFQGLQLEIGGDNVTEASCLENNSYTFRLATKSDNRTYIVNNRINRSLSIIVYYAPSATYIYFVLGDYFSTYDSYVKFVPVDSSTEDSGVYLGTSENGIFCTGKDSTLYGVGCLRSTNAKANATVWRIVTATSSLATALNGVEISSIA